MLKVNQPRLNLEKQLDAFAKLLPDQCLVLDAGAGDQSNARFFNHCIYESADFGKVEKTYAKPTYACDLREIPVPNSRYDAIIFSQVMEHLQYPQQVAKELARTLKPGGLLFYSAPLSFHEHEVPYDFYRYTQFGVRHIFTEAGFEVPAVLWLEGYLGNVSYQLTRMRKKLPSTVSAYGGGLTGFVLASTFTLFRPLAAILAFLAAVADRRHKWDGSGEPVNYYVVLKKPEISHTKS